MDEPPNNPLKLPFYVFGLVVWGSGHVNQVALAARWASRSLDLAQPYPFLMKQERAEWEGLRLTAKAADCAKAADELRPDFEKRLKELGYTPLGIAHAFSLLSGPGTVAEAREVLERYRG